MWKTGAALFLALSGVAGPDAPLDMNAVRPVFAELDALCTRANTALWGEKLCGPMMLAAPDGEIVTNRPAAGLASAGGGLFRGRLPDGMPAANTAIDWAGIRWTQLVLPLPDDPADRRVLLAHEAFHRIQPAIGIVTAEADNAHLDSYEGRLWLRLEAKALARALESGEAWREAARDALLFRAMRLRTFPGAGAAECALIRNEGLAEYTGVKAGGGAAAVPLALQRLSAERPSFVRTLGYIVGPAYGLLLDRTGKDWRAAARAGGCPPVLLQAAIGAAEGAAEARAQRYGYTAIAAEERQREDDHRAALARYTEMFVDGPVLLVRFEDMRIAFNPGRMTAFPPFGTVYGTGRVQDVWGNVAVEGDFLVSADRKSMRLPGPVSVADGVISGPGWTLTPARGWSARPGERGGDMVLAR